jgi:hypothetical protein
MLGSRWLAVDYSGFQVSCQNIILVYNTLSLLKFTFWRAGVRPMVLHSGTALKLHFLYNLLYINNIITHILFIILPITTHPDLLQLHTLSFLRPSHTCLIINRIYIYIYIYIFDRSSLFLADHIGLAV